MICGCGKPLGPKNKSGMCKVCLCRSYHTSPEMNAKRVDRLRSAVAAPECRAKKSLSLRAAMANISPEERQRRRERGIVQAATVLCRPDVRARTYSPQAIAQRGAARSETLIGWCPVAIRPLYRDLMHHIGAKAAREAVQDMIPGTPEHARRMIANVADAQRIRCERELAQSY